MAGENIVRSSKDYNLNLLVLLLFSSGETLHWLVSGSRSNNSRRRYTSEQWIIMKYNSVEMLSSGSQFACCVLLNKQLRGRRQPSRSIEALCRCSQKVAVVKDGLNVNPSGVGGGEGAAIETYKRTFVSTRLQFRFTLSMSCCS